MRRGGIPLFRQVRLRMRFGWNGLHVADLSSPADLGKWGSLYWYTSVLQESSLSLVLAG
jgi:hypothetical protein